MCGRYILVSKIKKIEEKFRVTADFDFEANYNLSAGQEGLVITSDEPRKLQRYRFGFTPSWAKKPTYIINARAEGDQNKDNNPRYTGSKAIIQKPYFRKSIRNQRCLVIADAFIEGTTKEKLQKPYLVYRKDKQRPFAFAGIYDEWANPNSGEILKTFAIITCPPNQLMQKIPHHRMPVILHEEDHRYYLRQSTPLAEICNLLRPYPSKQLNAYPISNAISKVSNNSEDLVQPIGKTLLNA